MFNHLAAEKELPWQAFSRGFLPSASNVGPISRHTLQALKVRGIPAGEIRNPIQLIEYDLEEADLIIALKELEHRPYVQNDFPHWEDRIAYWHVHDVDYATPEEALPQIEQNVQTLIHELMQPETA